MRESGQCCCGVALESRLGKAYNEEAFRYLLAIERKRAARSRRFLFLVLVSAKGQIGIERRLSPDVASGIFAAMWWCLREIDVAGWFREDVVVGAVLTAGVEPFSPEAVGLIARRLGDSLREHVSVDVTAQLRVRVVALGPGAAH